MRPRKYRIRHQPAIIPCWASGQREIPESWALEYHDGVFGWWSMAKYPTREAAGRALKELEK